MKKWLLVGLVVIALLAAPASALGTPKRATAFRGVWSSYTIQVAVPEVRIVKARLVYRDPVIRRGRRILVDRVQNGTVSLQRLDEFGSWITVDSTKTVGGRFSFRISSADRYRFRFKGTSTRKATAKGFLVRDRHLSISNLHAVSASVETSGDIFVTVAANINSTDSDITTDSPAVLLFAASTDSELLPFGALVLQTATHSGTYRVGFTVPSSLADSSCELEAMATMPGSFHVDSAAHTTFVPSDLLP